MTLSDRPYGARWLALGLLAPLHLAACGDDLPAAEETGTGTGTSTGTDGTTTTTPDPDTTGTSTTDGPDPDSTTTTGSSTGDTEGSEVVFTLQLLHASDQEGNVDAVADAPRFSAVLEALRAQRPEQSLTVTSGDVWIPGPFYASGADVDGVDVGGGRVIQLGGVTGRPDIAMQNAMGFQAASFGNHEWDRGQADVLAILGREDIDEDGTDDWLGAAFPYMSANLDFSRSSLADLVVEDGLPWDEAAGGISRSTVVTVAGEPIGIVGATTPTLEDISSPGNVGVLPPDDSTEALAAIIQESVDALQAAGIDKIVLLAPMQQIAIETELAGRLRGVDVIVAGGSNTLLADGDDVLRRGDEAEGPYPTVLTDADGTPLLLVNTDGNYRYVGRLVVGFDAAGVVVESSLDEAVNGAWATDDAGVEAVGGTPNPTVSAIADAVGQIIIEKDGNTFGATSVWLEGRRNFVRTEETNLGNLTSEANLAYALLVDPSVAVSIEHGGGIRREIGLLSVPAGSVEPPRLLPPQANQVAGKQENEVSQLDIEASLPFDDGLSLVTVSTDELRIVLEHAVSGWAPGATPGAFPQVAGLRFSFDPMRTAQAIDPMTGLVVTPGERVRNAAIVDEDGACVRAVVVDGEPVPGPRIRMVTLGFLADGGDGYPLGRLTTPMRVDLDAEDAIDPAKFPWTAAAFSPPGHEQDALAEYLAVTTSLDYPYARAETPPEGDLRIQNLAERSDAVLDGCP